MANSYREFSESEANAASSSSDIGLDIGRRRSSLIPYTDRLVMASAAPEELFIHFFTYLGYSDLTSCAAVSKHWREVVYDASLWSELDLSKIWHKVPDAVVIGLLSSPRFKHVQRVNLEGCRALTDHTVRFIIEHDCLRNATSLLLTDCSGITPGACMALVAVLAPKTLELLGIDPGPELGLAVRSARPEVAMPLYWIRVCALRALDRDSGQPVELDRCRHAGVHARQACWGTMRGRLLYSNRGQRRAGNYPSDVLFSCQTHMEEDMKDPELLRCELCLRLFRQEGMARGSVACNTCYDHENLRMPSKWLRLHARRVQKIGLSDLLNKTLKLRDKRNLPVSLKCQGTIRFRLSCLPAPPPQAGAAGAAGADDAAGADGVDGVDGVDGADRAEARRLSMVRALDPPLDPQAAQEVPLDLFREANQAGLAAKLDALKQLLRQAMQEGATRALLCFDDDRNVQVWTDAHPIVDRQGEARLRLTTRAWHDAWNVVGPFGLCMLIVMCYIMVMHGNTDFSNAPAGYAVELEQSRQETISFEYIAILAGGFVLAIGITFCMVLRCRAQCLKALQVFVFMDLLLLLILGTGMISFLTASVAALPLEICSSGLVVWNTAVLGIYGLYREVPVAMHRCCLGGLFTLMAVMMVGTLNTWICFFFASLLAIGDLVSMLRPRWLSLPMPLLRPTTLLEIAPNILYPLQGCGLRSIDLLWFGLALGLVPSTLFSLAACFVAFLGVLGISLFVMPFLGMSGVRPVPIAMAAAVVLKAISEAVMVPYCSRLTFLQTTVLTIGY